MMKRQPRIAAMGTIVLLCALGITACNDNSPMPITNGKEAYAYNKTEEETESIKKTESVVAAIAGINTKDKSFTVLPYGQSDDITLYYTGATNITGRYDSVMAASQVSEGQIYNIEYNKKTLEILSMDESKEAFESTNITNYSIDRTNKIISIGSHAYSFDDTLLILSEGKSIEMMELNNNDEITVRGIDKKVTSIVVTKGHGYLKLTNYNPFIGGFIDVGKTLITKITGDNMLLVVPEGSYKVNMQNGDYSAQRTVTIGRDKEVTLDFSDVVEIAKQQGRLKLTVVPENATVLVDDSAVENKESITLEYGKHTVTVSAPGYDTYNEDITINSAYMSKTIDITNQSETKSTTETGEEKITATKTTGAASSTYKTYIKAPEGAQVYMDGSLIGTAPVSTPKVAGTHVITFTKSGCENKTYTVDIDDDNADATFSFPAMLAN